MTPTIGGNESLAGLSGNLCSVLPENSDQTVWRRKDSFWLQNQYVKCENLPATDTMNLQRLLNPSSCERRRKWSLLIFIFSKHIRETLFCMICLIASITCPADVCQQRKKNDWFLLRASPCDGSATCFRLNGFDTAGGTATLETDSFKFLRREQHTVVT